jgi:threonyl-tRNA synthetase
MEENKSEHLSHHASTGSDHKVTHAAKKARHELYPKDDLDEEEFRWEEQPLKHGFSRPVIIHRAILGSLERFISILIEHTAGKWPFWLSPRQMIICPVSEKFHEYCEKVLLYFQQKGYDCEMDSSNQTLPKKVRNA